jgi:hypothetical protein
MHIMKLVDKIFLGRQKSRQKGVAHGGLWGTGKTIFGQNSLTF